MDLGDDLAAGDMRDVEIAEIGAEQPDLRCDPQRTDQRLSVVAEHGQRVVDVSRQARALGGDVENAEIAGDPGIGELKIGDMVDDRIIPAEPAGIDRLRQRRGEKGLGGRTDLEDRLRRDLLRLAERADAEALGVDQLVLVDDADGKARHREGLHALGDLLLEVRQQRFDRGLRRLLRLHRGIGHDGQADDERGRDDALHADVPRIRKAGRSSRRKRGRPPARQTPTPRPALR